MSTPAAAVLDGSGTPNPAGTAPGAAPGATPAGGAGAANQSFFSTWNDPTQKDVRDWVANKAYADPFTLAKSARELETSVATLRAAANLKGYPTETKNADGTVKPADENMVKAWKATMGVPESPDKYEIPLPSANPYPQFAKYMAEGLFEANVPGAMAPKLAQVYEAAVAKMETELRAQEDTTSKAALLELERDWGSNYQERVALAQRGKDWLAKEVGGLNDLQLRTLETVLGTAKFMSTMWKFGAGNKEPGFAGGSGNPAQFGNSAQAAQAEFDQNTANRTAGKISDFEWRAKIEPRQLELMQIIANGNAPTH